MSHSIEFPIHCVDEVLDPWIVKNYTPSLERTFFENRAICRFSGSRKITWFKRGYLLCKKYMWTHFIIILVMWNSNSIHFMNKADYWWTLMALKNLTWGISHSESDAQVNSLEQPKSIQKYVLFCYLCYWYFN